MMGIKEYGCQPHAIGVVNLHGYFCTIRRNDSGPSQSHDNGVGNRHGERLVQQVNAWGQQQVLSFGKRGIHLGGCGGRFGHKE